MNRNAIVSVAVAVAVRAFVLIPWKIQDLQQPLTQMDFQVSQFILSQKEAFGMMELYKSEGDIASCSCSCYCGCGCGCVGNVVRVTYGEIIRGDEQGRTFTGGKNAAE